jgi:hypothetical protein
VNYAPATRLEDHLAPDEPPYRSRGEAQVGRLLDRHAIPFFYELPTLIYDRGRHRIWHPDFSLPTYNSLIIEYVGMPDRPDYADGVRHKRHVYAANEIPTLFVYPKDLRGPRWPERLVERIEQAGSAVPEASGAGLPPGSGQVGVVHGGMGDARLDRVVRSDRITD